MADLKKQRNTPLPTCYLAESGRSALKGVGIYREVLGLCPLHMGVVGDSKHSPLPLALPCRTRSFCINGTGINIRTLKMGSS